MRQCVLSALVSRRLLGVNALSKHWSRRRKITALKILNTRIGAFNVFDDHGLVKYIDAGADLAW